MSEHIGTQFESAANLHTAGAVIAVADPSDPRNPIIYTAGSQDTSNGHIVLHMSSHSQRIQAHKAEMDKPRASKKYEALAGLSHGAKPGQKAAALQMGGMNRYTSMYNNRASLRSEAPTAKPAPKQAPRPAVPHTMTMTANQLNAPRKPQTPKSHTLAGRMEMLGAMLGYIPHLSPLSA